MTHNARFGKQISTHCLRQFMRVIRQRKRNGAVITRKATQDEKARANQEQAVIHDEFKRWKNDYIVKYAPNAGKDIGAEMEPIGKKRDGTPIYGYVPWHGPVRNQHARV